MLIELFRSIQPTEGYIDVWMFRSGQECSIQPKLVWHIDVDIQLLHDAIAHCSQA